MIDLPIDSYKEGEYESFNSGGVEKEVGELLYAFTRILKPLNVLDLGTHKGISAAYIALALKENNKGLVHTVEFDAQHWVDAEQLWEKVGVTPFIHQFKGTVQDYHLKFPLTDYDLMLIDTEPDQRWEQLRQFSPLLKEGGYVFLHDLPRGFCIGNVNLDHPDLVNWPWGEIPEEVKAWMKVGLLKPFHLPNPREMCGFYREHKGDYVI